MVQTTHSVTRPPDHPTTEYPTCVTITGPLYQVSYSCHDLHCCPPCHTWHHETSKCYSSNETMDKGKTVKTAPDSNSSLAKSMTHHNQTKKLSTWFLTLQYASYLSISIEHKQLKLCFYDICLDSQPELIHGRKPSLKFQFWIILIIHNNPSSWMQSSTWMTFALCVRVFTTMVDI
jgi:hypothetical protein